MEASLPEPGRSLYTAGPLSPFDQIRFAKEVLHCEASALQSVASRIDTSFCEAVELILDCSGSVIVSGMGKAGLIGQKITATLASTGTRSHFLHPAEAFHGDLGRVRDDDVALVLSQSGETEEVTRLLPPLIRQRIPIVAITQSLSSTLGQNASVVLELGVLHEACSLGLAPSTTTTAMLGYGDALSLVVSRMREFTEEDFARFHPGGSLGLRLSRVDELMRPLNQCRVAEQSQATREVLVSQRVSGRRTGAMMVVDLTGRLTGVFTDSDLARLLEDRRDKALDQAIQLVMTPEPTTILAGSLVGRAQEVMAERKISELPVVDAENRPIGLLDITDLLDQGQGDKPTIFPFVAPDQPGPQPIDGTDESHEN